MKKKKLKSKKDFDLDNTLNYPISNIINKNTKKKKFKNILTRSEIKYYDDLLEVPIPKESQKAQKKYSQDSDIFNNYYRLNKKEFNKKYGPIEKKIESLIKDLNNSKIILKMTL